MKPSAYRCWLSFNIWMFMLFLASISVLCVMIGNYFVVYDKFTDAQKGTCVTAFSRYDEETRKCNCGGRWNSCSRRYPCLQIFIRLYEDGSTFSTPSTPVNDSSGLTQMFENERTRRTDCSYKPRCRKSDENKLAVKEYEDKFGILGANYSCHYLPEDRSAVVRTLSGNKTRFFHMFFWPCLFTVIFFIALIVIKIKNPDRGILFVLGLEAWCCFKCCRRKLGLPPCEGRSRCVKAKTPCETNNYDNNAFVI